MYPASKICPNVMALKNHRGRSGDGGHVIARSIFLLIQNSLVGRSSSEVQKFLRLKRSLNPEPSGGESPEQVVDQSLSLQFKVNLGGVSSGHWRWHCDFSFLKFFLDRENARRMDFRLAWNSAIAAQPMQRTSTRRTIYNHNRRLLHKTG
ncbi:hypothetical protein CEXT_248841 [Caerostris extrusa]|uniref:Uncharacterized protein n=1 Tax=Caerostris extrusa TaxID=172846 RepID=A0AAV4TEP6_CAEEX|nr:hypothetical protein CEXT_248841 [Caerostris extrusa]